MQMGSCLGVLFAVGLGMVMHLVWLVEPVDLPVWRIGPLFRAESMVILMEVTKKHGKGVFITDAGVLAGF
jgi:hypothetical protein